MSTNYNQLFLLLLCLTPLQWLPWLSQSVMYIQQNSNIRRTPTSDFIKPKENVPHSLPPVSVSSSHVRYQDKENTTEGLSLET